MKSSPILLAVAGILLVAVLAVYGWSWLFPGPRAPSPEELAKTALDATTADEREKAAVALIPIGPAAVPVMRRVLKESDKPEVRAAMIQGLFQQRDLDSMPTFLTAMNDESMLVRTRAAAAVRYVLLDIAPFKADDPPEARKAAIEAYRKQWESLRASPAYDKLVERLKETGHGK